jgi:E3 ubiquitin-protein ligase RNF14
MGARPRPGAPPPPALPPHAEEDWQNQVDESQALESIFGADAFSLLDLQLPLPAGGPPGAARPAQHAAPPGQLDAEALAGVATPAGAWQLRSRVSVDVGLPHGSLRLRLRQGADGGGGGAGSGAPAATGTGGGEAGGSGQPSSGGGASSSSQPSSSSDGGGHHLQYLPPLLLHLACGPGYPSAHPPGVALSALWLPPGGAASLERQLRRTWEEQGPGVPVVYAWVDWLQSHALQHLGLERELCLGPGPEGEGAGRPDACDGGGGGGEPPAEAVLLSLLR